MEETQLEAVLRDAQMGDAVAFGRVVGGFSNRVFGLCRKMLGSQTAAEDATSEVFERAYQALDSYDRERPFDRWILTIASRHCLNRLRRERIEKRLFHDEIAEQLGTTRNNVAVLLHRAKRELRGRVGALQKEES
jgi:RNA polymerase sigma-70 factor (ECF subfamily)